MAELEQAFEVHNINDTTDIDPLELLHCRTGCTARSKLINAYRQQLVMNSGLRRYHLTKKANKKGYRYKSFLCGTCARTKITRKHFHRKEQIKHTEFLDKVTCDIGVYLNCPSREGHRYAIVFTDEATKYFWTYTAKERTTETIIYCLKDMYEKHLPPDAVIKIFHTDGGRELINERVKMYLRSKGTRQFTNSPTDTPELNSVSERKFRTLGEMTLAMLSRSGLPTIWWAKAYKAASYVLRRLPTNTAQGWMTPMEALPNGEVPSLEWLRVWGCKAYVLKPKADRRKDWDDKAQVGYFVGYSEDTVGWQVYLPDSDTFVTSVHVLFDENIPERSDDYFKELDDAAKVFVGTEAKSVADFAYLKGQYHVDDEDGLLYVTTRVENRKGYIVGYRAQVTAGTGQKEEKTPIHIADIEKLTKETEKSRKNTIPSVRKTIEISATCGDAQENMAFQRTTTDSRGRRGLAAKKSLKNKRSNGQEKRPNRKNRTGQINRSTGKNESEEETPTKMVAGHGTMETVEEIPLERPKQTGTSRSTEQRLSEAEDTRQNVGVTTSVNGQLRRGPRRSCRNDTEINMLCVTRERHVYLSEVMDTAIGLHEPVEPTSNKMAMACPEWREWQKAKIAENEALATKDVMRLVDIKPGIQLIKSKYVFKLKRKFGKIDRYKARLVAMGYNQEDDPAKNFAPVVKPNTVRLLMALAQTQKMVIHQIDISNAFCCADIEGEVHISAPDGMTIPEGKCFRLRKSLYGLRTSPRSWNRTLDKTLRGMHFTATISDPCLYYRWRKGVLTIILVYVDDILIASIDTQYIEMIKKDICNQYAMTDMGELDNFLNAKITRTREKITVCQTHYCRSILEHFQFLVQNKSTKTPLPSDALEQLASEDYTATESEEVKSYPYRQVIGALLYLAMYTKPEISYAVSMLSRFSDKKTATSCKLATHLLRYLNGHPECKIEFKGNNMDLHCFSDADWGGDILTRRSTTGYIIFAAGGPISWQSKLQPTVATSSLESEYMAMYAGLQELVWIRGVLKELKQPIDEPTPFLVDSKSAKDLAENPVYHKRSKHIDIKYHWIREHVNQGKFNTAKIYHCKTQAMAADIFTKSLTGSLFFQHAETITGKRIRSSEKFTQETTNTEEDTENKTKRLKR